MNRTNWVVFIAIGLTLLAAVLLAVVALFSTGFGMQFTT